MFSSNKKIEVNKPPVNLGYVGDLSDE